jgi:hypothetical protein
MEKKGLCTNCRSNTDCIFPGPAPVVECEEHSIGTASAKHSPEKAKKTHKK